MVAGLLRRKKNINSKVITFCFLIIFFIFLYFFNNIERVELVNSSGTSYVKAVVNEIVEDNIQEDGSRIGYQKVMLKVLSGKLKGQLIEGTSFAGYLYGADCTVGMKVIASISKYEDNASAAVYSYDRSNIIYIFVGLFLLMLWIIGGKKGFKSAIGLVFTFICIIYLFLPMLYKGYSPFLSAVIVIILITIVSLYLIDGITKKSISAMIGTIIGVIIAGICAAGFGYVAKISGYNVSEVEELVFVANNTELKVGGILFSAILIASLGAVMDVSITVNSAVNELVNAAKSITLKQLIKSIREIGHDIMGTMINVLMFSYIGGSLSIVILKIINGYNFQRLIQFDISFEIIRFLVGAIGIVSAVPISACVALLFFRKGMSKNDSVANNSIADVNDSSRRR